MDRTCRALLGDVWRLEGVGVPAQHLGGDGQQRRRINALAGCPICLGEDLAVEEAVQRAAQFGPDQLTDRHLLQEPCDFSGQGLRVQLLCSGVVGGVIVVSHVLHRAEAHLPALGPSGWYTHGRAG
jgi:hypothetical protein